jgi:hypothetical protein
MSFFSFINSENMKAEEFLWVVGFGTSGKGEEEKEVGRVNMVQILCTHVCKSKNGTSYNYSRNGETEI